MNRTRTNYSSVQKSLLELSNVNLSTPEGRPLQSLAQMGREKPLCSTLYLVIPNLLKEILQLFVQYIRYLREVLTG